MSWDEWLFKKTYQIYKGRNHPALAAQTVELSTLQRTLEIAFEAMTGEAVSVFEAQEFVGFYKGHLFLPGQIAVLPTSNLNKKLYWLLTCFHAVAVSKALKDAWDIDNLLSTIRADFPGFDESLLALRGLAEDQKKLFQLHRFFGNRPVLGQANDFGAVTYPRDQRDESLARTSVLQKKGPNVAEIKELDEAKENPLVHMFEKVNTVESYEGGNKSKQAEESLEEMKDSLEEVQLRTVIRSAERTPGLIKTDSIVETAVMLDEPSSFEQKRYKIYYPEWDQNKRAYREKWCAVTVLHQPPESATNVRTLMGQKLKMRLESLFNHFQWEGHQLDGPDLDLQPLIENQVSRVMGGAFTDRVFIKRVDQVKDFEVLIMMDESLSTESFIGTESVLWMMKDSVRDLAQAFESAPEQLAVMSFFSETRSKCSIHVLKDFSESIETLQSRLAKCRPQGYTRIGVAIRHAVATMKKSRSRRRCIVLVTDAKPTDVDRYEGRYGMADVKKAVEELRTEGLELIVLSYADRKHERFARMFPSQVSIFHATTQKAMTQGLLEVVERLALRH